MLALDVPRRIAQALDIVTSPFRFAARNERGGKVGWKGDELKAMRAALVSDGSRRTVILNESGGIRKTQLAVTYAKQHKESYSAVIWLNIRDEARVKQSFAITAERILRYRPSASYVSSADPSSSLDDIVKAVLAWLSESDNNRWLAIYDNYDDPRAPGNNDPDAVDIQRFLPDAYQGSVIVTTRSSQVKHGQKNPVRKLKSMQDGVDVLSDVSGKAYSVDGEFALAVLTHRYQTLTRRPSSKG
ncbi:hypothetical protein LTR49_028358 [Elasticomyces elasticus]|nr:hypothetical protein LTR49_028358 [Elasticomyces elasticus]